MLMVCSDVVTLSRQAGPLACGETEVGRVSNKGGSHLRELCKSFPTPLREVGRPQAGTQNKDREEK